MSFEGRISKGLERARSSAPVALDFEAETARVVVFSDLHRGARNRADDFRRCQPAMNAALAYYFERGYHLVMLGDVEELWEERPATVLENYSASYRLEAAFNLAGRYLRVFGNHDDHWADPRRVATELAARLGEVKVSESALLRFAVGSESVPFFLVRPPRYARQ